MLLRIILPFIIALGLNASERIVALSPSINEIIYALGGEGRIVGNTEFCSYPKESGSKPKVGGYFSPSLEKILSLNPDLVIMQKNRSDMEQKLGRLGIETRVIKIKRLADIKEAVSRIGDILEKQKEAAAIIGNIEKKLESLKDIVKGKKILIAIL